MIKVTVEQGVLVGGTNKTDNDKEYYEFLNVPYAKPPIGNLRFKSPQPPEPWIGEKNVSTEMQNGFCSQFDVMKNTVIGSENCLYLNVYTPKLSEHTSKPLPVMVNIHGGGFVIGSGTVKKQFNGPDFLLEQDVVVVSINYRLAAFGFLCLDISEAAGNMGLKDQVMALEWIQTNISNFGGDKDNVTLIGLSAGSASIEYQLLSPKSKGLFHKAILQSGSTLNHWAINENIKDLSLKLAENLGCKSRDINDVHKFLLEVPADQMSEVSFSLGNFYVTKTIYFGFVPTVEKDFGNGDAFITDNPYNILKEKKFHDVPLIKGFTDYEGLFSFSLKPHIMKEIMETMKLTDLINYAVDECYDKKLAEVYFDSYVKNNKDISEQPVLNFVSDLDFAAGIYISSLLMSEKTTPTYSYVFAYNSNLSILTIMEIAKRGTNSQEQELPEKRGAGHGDDLFYILKGDKEVLPLEYNEDDILMTKKMSTMFTNFAKTGNPTPIQNQLLPVKWPVFTTREEKYLEIDKELEVKSKYFPNRIAVFTEMYEEYRK